MGDEKIVRGGQAAGPQGSNGSSSEQGGAGALMRGTALGMSYTEGELAFTPRELAALRGDKSTSRKKGKGPKTTEMVFDDEAEVVGDPGEGASDKDGDAVVAQYLNQLKTAVGQLAHSAAEGIDGFASGMRFDLGEGSNPIMAAIETGIGNLFTAVLGQLANIVLPGVGALVVSTVRSAFGAFEAAKRGQAAQRARHDTEVWASKLASGYTDAATTAMQELDAQCPTLEGILRGVDDMVERRALMEELKLRGLKATSLIPPTTVFKDEATIAWVTNRQLGAKGKSDSGTPKGRIAVDVSTEQEGSRFKFEVDRVSLHVASQGENAVLLVREVIGRSSLWSSGIPVQVRFERPHVSGGWSHTTLDMKGPGAPSRRLPMFPEEEACWKALSADAAAWQRMQTMACDDLKVGS